MDKQTLTEAVVVGAALLPMYAVMHEVVEKTVRGRNTDVIAVFLSGCAFHILAEATGLNDWYAANKSLSDRKVNVASSVRHRDGRICSLALRVCEDKRE